MKLPRVSTRSIMIVLIVVAVDCVIYRSFSTRSRFLAGDLIAYPFATLPMANLVAVLIALVVRDGAKFRPFGLGFALGGVVALVVTCLGMKPALYAVGNNAAISSGLNAWASVSQARELIAQGGLLMVAPFLLQLMLALAGGQVGKSLTARLGSIAVAIPKASGRSVIWSFVALTLLLLFPALIVEGYFRRNLDSLLARRSAGENLAVTLQNPLGQFVALPRGSNLQQIVGSKARVEQDADSSLIEIWATPNGDIICDRRPVRVTLLDGERAGESLQVPYCYLRPVR